jgi:hypothetical protein
MTRRQVDRVDRIERSARRGAMARIPDDELMSRIIASCEAAASMTEHASRYREAAERHRAGPVETAQGWDDYIVALDADLRFELDQLRAAGLSAADLSRELGRAS